MNLMAMLLLKHKVTQGFVPDVRLISDVTHWPPQNYRRTARVLCKPVGSPSIQFSAQRDVMAIVVGFQDRQFKDGTDRPEYRIALCRAVMRERFCHRGIRLQALVKLFRCPPCLEASDHPAAITRQIAACQIAHPVLHFVQRAQ
jgi:hypothetical protein